MLKLESGSAGLILLIAGVSVFNELLLVMQYVLYFITAVIVGETLNFNRRRWLPSYVLKSDNHI